MPLMACTHGHGGTGYPAGSWRATPYVRATSLTGRFSTMTAVITRRAFDIPAESGLAVLYVLRHPVLNVLRLDTTRGTLEDPALAPAPARTASAS